jgi:hypothetical protein
MEQARGRDHRGTFVNVGIRNWPRHRHVAMIAQILGAANQAE